MDCDSKLGRRCRQRFGYEAVYDSGASLVVVGPCFSSCANYIFLAARQKYVLPESVVGWHGGIPESAQSDADPAAPLIARSRAFIAKIGVNPDLFEKYPEELENSPDFRRSVDAKQAPSWTYSKSDLERRFLVKGIVTYWFPDCPTWKKKMDWTELAHLFRADQCH